MGRVHGIISITFMFQWQYSKPLMQHFHTHLFYGLSCIMMTFSCHLQKLSRHDVIVSVVFWQLVPAQTRKAINSFIELFQKRVPGGFGVTTTGGGVNLTVSVTQIPTKRNTFYCHFKAHMVCARFVAVWAFEISMCQTHTIDYCSSWMIWLHLVNKHYFLKLPFH